MCIGERAARVPEEVERAWARAESAWARAESAWVACGKRLGACGERFDASGKLLWTAADPAPEGAQDWNKPGMDASPTGDAVAGYLLESGTDRSVLLQRVHPDGQQAPSVVLTRARPPYTVGVLGVDASGNVFESGEFIDALDGTPLVSSAGSSDSFLLQHDAEGRLLGYASVGSPGTGTWPIGVTVDKSGHALLAVVTNMAQFTADLTIVRYAP